jgi:hypothetical protein
METNLQNESYEMIILKERLSGLIKNNIYRNLETLDNQFNLNSISTSNNKSFANSLITFINQNNN